MLSSLQDNGLTDVMLHALLIKDVSSLFVIMLNVLLSRQMTFHSSLTLSFKLDGIEQNSALQVPATREVLGSLPNVFSALCLNARGLHSFVQCQPFERLFKVLLSPDYLPAMRRRRSSDPLGEFISLDRLNILIYGTFDSIALFFLRGHCIQFRQCCG